MIQGFNKWKLTVLEKFTRCLYFFVAKKCLQHKINFIYYEQRLVFKGYIAKSKCQRGTRIIIVLSICNILFVCFICVFPFKIIELIWVGVVKLGFLTTLTMIFSFDRVIKDNARSQSVVRLLKTLIIIHLTPTGTFNSGKHTKITDALWISDCLKIECLMLS